MYMNQKVYTTQIIEDILQNYLQGNKINDSIFYRGQIGFRKAGILFEFTEEEKEEYLRCNKDIIYFAEKYCKIVDPHLGERRQIKLRDYQKDFLRKIDGHRFNVAAVSRQTGITTVEAIEILHAFIFSADKTIQIVDIKIDAAHEKLQKVKDMFRQLPFFIQPGIHTMNKSVFVAENFSAIKTNSYSKNVAIGYQIHDLHLGNFAFASPSKLESFYKSIMPCMAALKNSKVVITSTPNGHNMFYKLYQDAQEGKNDFAAQSIYWWQVPGRDEAWKEQEIKNLGSVEAFNQEYNLQFFNHKKK
jgi:hypothetical protein